MNWCCTLISMVCFITKTACGTRNVGRTYARRNGMATTAKRLPATLKVRVIGATFHSRHMKDDEFMDMPRGQQVHEDVLRRRPLNWLALDDDSEGWPVEHAARFAQTHIGLNDPDVQEEFKRKLKDMCK